MVGFLKRKFNVRHSDIILALFVVAIAAMLLVPLPTALLDLLLVINISFSLLLLMVGLYMPNALALLSFPSLLLLTTLFRLGLNVASTRLILSQGNAGEVIEAFGTFLIKGEVVVGVLIFTIITIVNFIVVAKGSSRVSEVAARFALDALPGKQMAIDSDLRAGILTPNEAEVRREELRKESQLFGSMDGAMKFVQGDAIAGFFIIVVNIFGGLYLGVKNGLTFAEAVQTYTTLTVGDGLVSQIPSLLISICAGIVVTRVASSEQSTLGSDVGEQIFQRPGSVLFAGFLLLAIGFFPGLPVTPFTIVGVGFVLGGIYLARLPQHSSHLPVVVGEAGLSALPRTEGGGEGASSYADVLTIELEGSTLFRVYQQGADHYRKWWVELQEVFYDQVGIRLPAISFVPAGGMQALEYSVSLGGTECVSGKASLDARLVELHPNSATVMGLEVLREERHPLTGHNAFWVENNAATERILKAGVLRSWDWLEHAMLRAAVFCQYHPAELFSMSDCLNRVKELEKKHPGLVSEGLDTAFITTARLTEILQELVREGVSIRNFRSIVEAIASYCHSYGLSLVQQNEFDLHDIIGFVRLQRKRQLLSSRLSHRDTLRVVSLSDEVETILSTASFEGNDVPLGLDRQTYHGLHKGLLNVVDPVYQKGVLPIVILCRPELRHRVCSFVRFSELLISSVTHDELEPRHTVEVLGTWKDAGI